MTTYLDRTHNPLLIVAIIAVMLCQRTVRTLYLVTCHLVTHAAGFVATYWYPVLLCLVPILGIVAVNVAWPLIAMSLGKLLLGGVLIAAFAVVSQP